MDFQDLIHKRFACRAYAPKRVEKTLLYEIIGNALMAPSAKNSQPWSFYVSTTEEENEKIRACLTDSGRNPFLASAPAFIAIFETEPDTIACEKYGNDRFVKYDIGEVTAYLTLAAKDRGLDSCVIGWINEERLRDVTGVQKPCGIVIALGYAAEGVTAPPKKRAPLESKILNYKKD